MPRNLRRAVRAHRRGEYVCAILLSYRTVEATLGGLFHSQHGKPPPTCIDLEQLARAVNHRWTDPFLAMLEELTRLTVLAHYGAPEADAACDHHDVSACSIALATTLLAQLHDMDRNDH